MVEQHDDFLSKKSPSQFDLKNKLFDYALATVDQT